MSHNILVDRFLPPASIAQYPGIIDAIENAVRQTACLSTTSDAPRFADFESFIPVQTEKPVNDALLLVVDVGGTYTKVALRYHQTNHTDWFPLFKARNYEITPESGADRFVRMLDALFSLTIDKLSEHNTNADQIQGISVVWSNALNCYPLDPADRGLVCLLYTSPSPRDPL